ncbi:hypothetical protein [Streptomyces sp. 3213.3]|uniref:hypothetical protein n=1 Tax=Streptomyces sp. 3213.3 TaxID=1855348 RepID=UPI0010421BAA|nr:hypothetical protein [Streptomyces sp. 3213.3]
MSAAFQPQFHPAGFDDALRTALDDIRAGRWRSTGEGDRRRGLWIVRRRGAEISYAPTAEGKIVQALIEPPVLPADSRPRS